MTTIKVNRQINSFAIIIAIVQLSGILFMRLAKCIINSVVSCYTWLVSKHTYFTQEGAEEAITMTGIQYVGVGILTSIVCVLLSIQW